MGYWTFTTIKQEVRKLTGRPQVTQISETEIGNYINNFYQLDLPKEIPRFFETWYETTTTKDVESITIPSDYVTTLKPYMIDGSVSGVTIYTDATSFYLKWPTTIEITHDKPVNILIEFPTIIFRPIPDDAYSFKCKVLKKPTALVNPADEPINQEFGELLAYGAAIKIKNVYEEDVTHLVTMYDYLLTKLNRTTIFHHLERNIERRF